MDTSQLKELGKEKFKQIEKELSKLLQIDKKKLGENL